MRGKTTDFDQQDEVSETPTWNPRVTPGKRTRSERVYASMPAPHARRTELLDETLANGGGSPLPSDVQRQAQDSLGADMSGVRVHTNSDAHDLAGQFGYRAFSYGSDVFFGAQQYQPSSPEGRNVVMHELAHVAQTGGERAGGIHAKIAIGTSGDASEIDADRGAAAVMAGRSYTVMRAPLAVRGFGATGDGITHENQTLTGAKAAQFSARDAQMMYSGNWMRDMNQLLLPKVQSAAPAIYEVLNIAHTAHFGFPFGGSMETAGEGGDGSFRAAGASQEFGTYDPVEHIDNPGGLSASDVFDQNGDSAGNASVVDDPPKAYANLDPRYVAERQRMLDTAGNAAEAIENPDDNVAHQVDQSGVPVYIAASGTQMIERFAQGARLANFGSGPNPRRSQANRDRALRCAGEALHIMQDYYAHSNFCEIAMNLLLREGTTTLGDSDGNRIGASELRNRLQALDSGAGSYELDTYVHEREGQGDAADRDTNARTRGGRAIMATGTFTLEDTMQSIKEKLSGAVNALEPFSGGADTPSPHALAVLGWLESNPEYVGDTRGYIQGFGQILSNVVPHIATAMRTVGGGAELLGGAEAAVERNVGGAVRRGWHNLAGGVTSLFGGDSTAHDNAAANADATAESNASAAETEGHDVRVRAEALSAQLAAISAILAQGNGGLRELYRLGWETNQLLTLEGLARQIPIIGTDLAPIVKAAVDEVKNAAKAAIRALWTAAKPHIIAELNAAAALALGDTEVQRSDSEMGGTTSGTFTQPTHTDIAKDFDSHAHGSEDTSSLLMGASELFSQLTNGARVVGTAIRTAYRSVQSGDSTPALAIAQMAETVRTAATSGDGLTNNADHDHENRHGGAWLAPLAHQMATAATTDILGAYRTSLDGGPAEVEGNINAQTAVIRSYYCHPADCRGRWEGTFAAALSGQSTSSQELLTELARRTAQPPSVQAPNDEQYSDAPSAHAHQPGDAHHDHDDHDHAAPPP